MDGGRFIVSLDFEKLWGLIDLDTYESFKSKVAGVDTALPRILKLSDKYGVRVTVATVGMLMCRSKREIMEYSPDLHPTYLNKKLLPYGEYLETKVGESETEDRLHYGLDLVESIRPPHEIASHTFCHYYCNAAGQNANQFSADLSAAVAIAKERNLKLSSIVFPRNECREEYLEICSSHGFKYYRGNERNWLHDESIKVPRLLSWLRRGVRLLDTYVPISGHNCYAVSDLGNGEMLNIRASRFLRQYSPSLKYFDGLKLRRICRDMTYAAKNNLVFHLWWHPHNFGAYQDENIAFLTKVYEHYLFLNKKYGFKSLTFSDLGQEIK